MPALLDRSEQRLASSRAGRAQSRALFALAAARALAGLGIREIAAAANISLRTLHRLETSG
jgi:AcrR family transcriptional regulator